MPFSFRHYIDQTIEQNTIAPETKVEELMVQIDGGHLKDRDPDTRSFEAMAGVIYRPDKAQELATSLRKNKQKRKLDLNESLRKQIVNQLKQGIAYLVSERKGHFLQKN